MLEVSLLGEQYISGSSLRQVRHSSRSVALLAYLALHADAPQSRLRIAGAFWPDSTDGQARTNLRRELHHLRQLLGDDPSLVVEPATLTWCDRPTCRVDLRVFARERWAALESRDAGDRLAHAHRAVAEYGGDLLPGLYDDWVLEARQRLRRHCVALLDQLVDDLRGQGNLERATEYARRRVAEEPLEEIGYRADAPAGGAGRPRRRDQHVSPVRRDSGA
jgi:DNA-binding SARP family transcriptional activator